MTWSRQMRAKQRLRNLIPPAPSQDEQDLEFWSWDAKVERLARVLAHPSTVVGQWHYELAERGLEAVFGCRPGADVDRDEFGDLRRGMFGGDEHDQEEAA